MAYQKWVDDVGIIDSKFRFHAAKVDPDIEGVIRIFKLVHTGNHWELGSDGRLKEINDSVEWRIEGFLTRRTASRASAIRYLNRKLDEITDPTLKANAERKIGILKGLPKPKTHI